MNFKPIIAFFRAVDSYVSSALFEVTDGLRRAMEEMPDNIYPRKFLAVGRSELIEAVREKMRLFGSSGTA